MIILIDQDFVHTLFLYTIKVVMSPVHVDLSNSVSSGGPSIMSSCDLLRKTTAIGLMITYNGPISPGGSLVAMLFYQYLMANGALLSVTLAQH